VLQVSKLVAHALELCSTTEQMPALVKIFLPKNFAKNCPFLLKQSLFVQQFDHNIGF
jgi:hypothetical protein